MNVSAKSAASLIVSMSIYGLVMTMPYYLFFKPASEYFEYTGKKQIEASDAYSKAAMGDQKALARLEELTSERAGAITYLMLSELYKKEAAQAAEIDYNDPHANIELVDVSKSDNLILRAMRVETDINLQYILSSSRLKFDDKKKDAMIEGLKDETTYLSNYMKLEAKSTFDQATKDRLLSCLIKLDSQYSNRYKKILGYSTTGACSDTPPEGAFFRLINKIFSGRSTSNNHN